MGLTGGIGTGKSSFCAAFSRLSVPIIDADIIAHNLSHPYSTANLSIAKLLGEQSLLDDGTLNRTWLRDTIFNDNKIKKQVEDIFHPLILKEVKFQIAQLKSDHPYCILAVPLLFEQPSFLKLTQLTIVIDCSEQEQIMRVMQRSGLNQEQVQKIIQSQMGRAERNNLADLVISNEDGLESIDNKVSQLHKLLLEKT